jgi:competence protein ComEA
MEVFMRNLSVLVFSILLALTANIVTAAPVNINVADAATLSASLKGVGLKKAQAIVAYREAHGPFKTQEDLANVKGIGLKTIELNRKDLLLEEKVSIKPKK